MKSFCRLALTLIALFAPPSAPAQSAVLDTADPVLNPGDVLRITVWRRPELSGEFDVGQDGSIAHPLYREVRVAGLTVSVAEERVRVFLRPYEPNAALVVTALFRVIVGGDVLKPGLYALKPTTTIAQAVAVAGGPNERGRIDRVRISRQGTVRLIDLTRPGTDLLLIRSGDQIIVGRRHSTFRDVIVPASSVLAAAAAIAGIAVQLNRR